uniref:Uncharacterized protein n=1 Tax=Romanomermis culicivorax TaxID=13658 RepID=A0A915IMI8_ROMCU
MLMGWPRYRNRPITATMPITATGSPRQDQVVNLFTQGKIDSQAWRVVSGVLCIKTFAFRDFPSHFLEISAAQNFT